MKNFISKLRGKQNGQRAALTHPEQLMPGDLLTLDDSFVLPSLLRGARLEVIEVNTYQYQYSHFPEWILKGDGDKSIFFSIDTEDGESTAAFSIKIEEDEVKLLFEMDAFSTIFEEENGTTLEISSPDGDLAEWVSHCYRQESGAERAYFYRRDYRGLNPPQEEGEGEPFDYYLLNSADGMRAVEIEVWEGGETDVLLTVYRPLTDIRELWPAKQGAR